jgi:hypothetical protein
MQGFGGDSLTSELIRHELGRNLYELRDSPNRYPGAFSARHPTHPHPPAQHPSGVRHDDAKP